jgi:antitoxin YefM
MTTLTATEARKRLYKMVEATRSGRVFRIRHRSGDAVLLSEEEYEGLLETLQLLSIPGLRASLNRSAEDAKRGRTRSMKAVLGDER